MMKRGKPKTWQIRRFFELIRKGVKSKVKEQYFQFLNGYMSCLYTEGNITDYQMCKLNNLIFHYFWTEFTFKI